MLKIGLTGGIGSGKSTVAAVFETLGIPVYYADDRAKKLLNEDPELTSQIKKHFGPQAYQGGSLDRAFMSRWVFNDEAKLALLNSLVHPVTIRDSAQWMNKQTTLYALKEAALIFESKSDKYLDYVIGVFAPEDLRIQRAMDRDRASEKEIRKRISSQMPEKEKMERCHFIITNDERQAVLPQVLALHTKLLALAQEKVVKN